jgi:hypothetical protein
MGIDFCSQKIRMEACESLLQQVAYHKVWMREKMKSCRACQGFEALVLLHYRSESGE